MIATIDGATAQITVSRSKRSRMFRVARRMDVIAVIPLQLSLLDCY